MKLSQLILTVTFTGSSALYTHGRQRRSAADCPFDWMNDPDDDTVCIPDHPDFSVTCNAQSMTVEFTYNHLYENIQEFLTGNSQVNTGTTVIGNYGSGLCDITRDANYDANYMKFSIAIPYSDACITLDHSNGAITAQTLFEGHTNLATETDFDNTVGLHVGQLLSFTASCQWADTETINMGALGVFTDDFDPLGGTPDEGDAGYTGFTPSFTMLAYNDNTFAISIDTLSESVEIGEKIYIQIGSDDNLGQNGMFEWFVSGCTVYQTDANSGVSYQIISVSELICF